MPKGNYDNLIKSFARSCYYNLPERSKAVFTLDDLFNEGKIVEIVARLDYDKTRSKFSTHLHYKLHGRFKEIQESEWRLKRGSGRLDSIKQDHYAIPDKRAGPEDIAIFFEALGVLAEVSKELVDIILHGFPKDLVGYAKGWMRVKQYRQDRKAINGRVIITKEMIEKYYGISLKEILKIFQEKLRKMDEKPIIINRK